MRLLLPDPVATIVRELRASGHRAVVVGGAVRDAMAGLAPKDFDIEVYGVAYDQLTAILSQHGPIDLVRPQRPRGDGEGDAPVKTCPECRSILPAAATECPDCGYAFPPREIKIDRTASTLASGPSGTPWSSSARRAAAASGSSSTSS